MGSGLSQTTSAQVLLRLFATAQVTPPTVPSTPVGLTVGRIAPCTPLAPVPSAPRCSFDAKVSTTATTTTVSLYNLILDFSFTNNPSGPWSYRSAPDFYFSSQTAAEVMQRALLNNVTYVASGSKGWTAAPGSGTASMTAGIDPASRLVEGNRNSMVVLHPGCQGPPTGFAVVRWTLSAQNAQPSSVGLWSARVWGVFAGSASTGSTVAYIVANGRQYFMRHTDDDPTFDFVFAFNPLEDTNVDLAVGTGESGRCDHGYTPTNATIAIWREASPATAPPSALTVPQANTTSSNNNVCPFNATRCVWRAYHEASPNSLQRNISSSTVQLAALYDLEEDFGLLQNPDGPWFFGVADNLVFDRAAMRPMTRVSTNEWRFSGWTTPGQTAIVMKQTVAGISHGSSTGGVMMHPGCDAAREMAWVRWTAPAAGVVNATGWVLRGDSRGVSGLFVFAGRRQLVAEVPTGPENATVFSFDSVAVERGWTLDLIISIGPDSKCDYGYTPVGLAVELHGSSPTAGASTASIPPPPNGNGTGLPQAGAMPVVETLSWIRDLCEWNQSACVFNKSGRLVEVHLNAGKDFSMMQNPRGPWSYMAAPFLQFDNVTLLSLVGSYADLVGWTKESTTRGTGAMIMRTIAQPPEGGGTTTGVDDDELVFQPGCTQDMVLLRFTAPSDGVATITIRLARASGGTAAAFAFAGGRQLFGATVMPNVTLERHKVELRTGETIDVFLTVGIDGKCDQDFTRLVALYDFAAGATLPKCAFGFHRCRLEAPQGTTALYDLAADFSVAEWPTAWAYGRALEGDFDLSAAFMPIRQRAVPFNRLLGFMGPAVSRTGAMIMLNLGPSADRFLQGDIILEAGCDDHDSAWVRWTAPGAGVASVSGRYRRLSDGDISFYVFAGGRQRVAAASVNEGRSFSFRLPVTNGSAIDFIAAIGAQGKCDNGFAALVVSIELDANSTISICEFDATKCESPGDSDRGTVPLVTSTFGIRDDFNVARNPNGPWSYLYAENGMFDAPLPSDVVRRTTAAMPLPPPPRLMANRRTFSGWSGWGQPTSSAGDGAFFALNVASSSLRGSLPGSLVTQPGCGPTEMAVARWTSPVHGRGVIWGNFTATGPGETAVYVVWNRTHPLLGATTVPGRRGSPQLPPTPIVVDVGTVIDLYFAVGPDKICNEGFTMIDFTIDVTHNRSARSRGVSSSLPLAAWASDVGPSGCRYGAYACTGEPNSSVEEPRNATNATVRLSSPPVAPVLLYHYDVAKDFSISTNPNAAWSYGWSPPGPFRDRPYALFARRTQSPFDAWDASVDDDGNAGQVGRNIRTSTSVFGVDALAPFLFPGCADTSHDQSKANTSRVRWTSPADGLARLSFSFHRGNTAILLVSVFVSNTWGSLLTRAVDDGRDVTDADVAPPVMAIGNDDAEQPTHTSEGNEPTVPFLRPTSLIVPVQRNTFIDFVATVGDGNCENQWVTFDAHVDLSVFATARELSEATEGQQLMCPFDAKQCRLPDVATSGDMAQHPVPAAATLVYNMSNDFAMGRNPNGPWTYAWLDWQDWTIQRAAANGTTARVDGMSVSPGGDAPLPSTGQYGPPNLLNSAVARNSHAQWYFQPSAVNSSVPPPFVALSNKDHPRIGYNARREELYGIPGRTMNIIPGCTFAERRIAIVRWTAPRSGTVVIEATFTRGGNGAVFHAIILNAKTTLFMRSDQGVQRDLVYVHSVEVNGTVDVCIGAMALPCEFMDTPVNVTITMVPMSPPAAALATGRFIINTSHNNDTEGDGGEDAAAVPNRAHGCGYDPGRCSLGYGGRTVVVYSAAEDFSVVSNPNGAWSYGLGLLEHLGGHSYLSNLTMTLADAAWSESHLLWLHKGLAPGDESRSRLPCVGRNLGSAANFAIGAGQFVMHPDTDRFGWLRWTAPGEGTIDVTALFFDGDAGAMSCFAVFNRTDMIGYTAAQRVPRKPFAMYRRNVENGTAIDIFVGPTANGQISQGATPLEVNITWRAKDRAPLCRWRAALCFGRHDATYPIDVRSVSPLANPSGPWSYHGSTIDPAAATSADTPTVAQFLAALQTSLPLSERYHDNNRFFGWMAAVNTSVRTPPAVAISGDSQVINNVNPGGVALMSACITGSSVNLQPMGSVALLRWTSPGYGVLRWRVRFGQNFDYNSQRGTAFIHGTTVVAGGGGGGGGGGGSSVFTTGGGGASVETGWSLKSPTAAPERPASGGVWRLAFGLNASVTGRRFVVPGDVVHLGVWAWSCWATTPVLGDFVLLAITAPPTTSSLPCPGNVSSARCEHGSDGRVVYNLARDFLWVTNPNDVWAYGTVAADDGVSLTLWTTVLDGELNAAGWSSADDPDHSSTSSRITRHLGRRRTLDGADPGQVVVSACPGQSASAVRFTFPANGTVSIWGWLRTRGTTDPSTSSTTVPTTAAPSSPIAGHVVLFGRDGRVVGKTADAGLVPPMEPTPWAEGVDLRGPLGSGPLPPEDDPGDDLTAHPVPVVGAEGEDNSTTSSPPPPQRHMWASHFKFKRRVIEADMLFLTVRLTDDDAASASDCVNVTVELSIEYLPGWTASATQSVSRSEGGVSRSLTPLPDGNGSLLSNITRVLDDTNGPASTARSGTAVGTVVVPPPPVTSQEALTAASSPSSSPPPCNRTKINPADSRNGSAMVELDSPPPCGNGTAEAPQLTATESAANYGWGNHTNTTRAPTADVSLQTNAAVFLREVQNAATTAFMGGSASQTAYSSAAAASVAGAALSGPGDAMQLARSSSAVQVMVQCFVAQELSRLSSNPNGSTGSAPRLPPVRPPEFPDSFLPWLSLRLGSSTLSEELAPVLGGVVANVFGTFVIVAMISGIGAAVITVGLTASASVRAARAAAANGPPRDDSTSSLPTTLESAARFIGLPGTAFMLAAVGCKGATLFMAQLLAAVVNDPQPQSSSDTPLFLALAVVSGCYTLAAFMFVWHRIRVVQRDVRSGHLRFVPSVVCQKLKTSNGTTSTAAAAATATSSMPPGIGPLRLSETARRFVEGAFVGGHGWFPFSPVAPSAAARVVVVETREESESDGAASQLTKRRRSDDGDGDGAVMVWSMASPGQVRIELDAPIFRRYRGAVAVRRPVTALATSSADDGKKEEEESPPHQETLSLHTALVELTATIIMAAAEGAAGTSCRGASIASLFAAVGLLAWFAALRPMTTPIRNLGGVGGAVCSTAVAVLTVAGWAGLADSDFQMRGATVCMMASTALGFMGSLTTVCRLAWSVVARIKMLPRETVERAACRPVQPKTTAMRADEGQLSLPLLVAPTAASSRASSSGGSDAARTSVGVPMAGSVTTRGSDGGDIHAASTSPRRNPLSLPSGKGR